MQALESLNDSQVNEFLSGKTPLNLSMRLGDHMMLIQLQLSTVNPTNSSASTSAGSSGSVNSSRTRSIFRSKTSSSARPSLMAQQSSSTNSTPIRFTNANHMYKSLSSDQLPEKYRNRHETVSPQPSTSRAAAAAAAAAAAELIESKNEFEELRTIVSSLGKEKIESKSSINDGDVDMETSLISTEGDALLEQSPIKSLSNLVSGPIKTSSLKNIPMSTPTATTITTSTTTAATATAANATTTTTNNTNNKLTSCPCKSVESSSTSASGCDTNCQYSRTRHQLQHKKYINHSELKTATRSSTLLHKTLNNPIAKTKSAGFQSIQSARATAATAATTSNDANATILRRSKSSDNISNAEQGIAKMVTAKSLHNELSVDQPINIIDTTAGNTVETMSDTLAEASRNLTKTLRKLSKEVFSSKSDASAIAVSEEKRARPTTNNTTPTNSSSTGSHQTSSSVAGFGFGSGAVIESMRNHGRGIYSGTFSGTLNPALQDRYGRPKRDISTIIHILNDLLSATPHYSRGARISFEPAHSSRKYVSKLNIKFIAANSIINRWFLIYLQSSSSKRISSSSGSAGSIQSQRSHCSKCPAASSSKSGCSVDCHKSSGAHRNTSRHIYVTNDSAQASTSKSTSLPSTPVTANTSIDCRQCQMPMSSSAPVTPTASPNQSIKDSMDSSLNTTLDSSNSSAFDFRNSTGDLSMSSTSSSPLSTSQTSAAAVTAASIHPICTKCSNMEIENNKTKTKLDQLRLVMQQRRERREARKMRSAPYGGRIIGAAATNSLANASATNSTNPNDGSNANVIQATVEAPPTNPIVEQVNTLA